MKLISGKLEKGRAVGEMVLMEIGFRFGNLSPEARAHSGNGRISVQEMDTSPPKGASAPLHGHGHTFLREILSAKRTQKIVFQDISPVCPLVVTFGSTKVSFPVRKYRYIQFTFHTYHLLGFLSLSLTLHQLSIYWNYLVVHF